MNRTSLGPQRTQLCPVCQMTVNDDDLWRCYRGIKYYFCSQQCIDRFIALPGLYCGDPKHGKSDKQKGKKSIKIRRIVLSTPIPDGNIQSLKNSISELMGVDALEMGSDELKVKYDLLVVSLKEIEHVIEKTLGEFKSPIVDKIRRGWIRYTEECELDNRSHPGTHGGCH